MSQNLRFSALASRCGFGAAICVAVVRSSIVFFDSVFAGRSGIPLLRFLAAPAACVILLYFAAESRKSYCSGCMKVANAALSAKFSLFWRILCSRLSV